MTTRFLLIVFFVTMLASAVDSYFNLYANIPSLTTACLWKKRTSSRLYL